MICCYDKDATNFDNNGSVVLMPTECTITEDAGGSYELAMKHPIDESGKWEHLVPGAIIKAPIPVRTIKSAFSGVDADIYVTNTDAPLRDGTSEPETITYPAWVSGTIYLPPARVSYNGKNYQLNSPLSTIDASMPPSRNPKWTQIASGSTAGSGILITLKTGTEVLFVSDAGNGWYYVCTWTGIYGYIKTSQLTYSHHQDPEEIADHEITEQLFRIYKNQINSSDQMVSVNARHVSYDLSGVIMKTCKIVQASPALAITMMINSYMIEYQGTIATNLTQDDNGKYTATITGKNATYGLMDPDNGMVGYFAAQLHRDNWDIFVMKNDITDRGIRMVYGKNMRGVTWQRDAGSLINRVVPIAKNENGDDLYLTDPNPPNPWTPWVDSETLSHADERYPVIIMEQLKVNGQVGRDDGTENATNWEIGTLRDEMRTKALERFNVDHVDALKTQITIDFTQLSDSVEYSYLEDLERIEMYDQITVEHPDLGLSQQLQVSQIVWDAILERYISIKVGDVFDYGGRTTTGYSVGEDAIYYEKINGGTIDQIRRESVEDTLPYVEEARTNAISAAYYQVMEELRNRGIIT